MHAVKSLLMSKNNIFISWSGKRSLHAADALREWLPNVVQSAKPWMSDRDIEKGTRGLTEVGKALEGMKVGIICLTPENLDAAWILYEAGALSKTFSDDKARLCTYLLGGLQPQDVKPPLSMFQSSRSEKEDTRKLVQAINAAMEEPLPPERLKGIFDTWWPQLEEKLKGLPAPERVVDAKRDPNEMISEILALCRQYLPHVGLARLDNIIAPPHPPVSTVTRRSEYEPSDNTIWVKRKGIENLEFVDGKSYLETPAPNVLIIYRGTGVLAQFDDVEKWGYWGDIKEKVQRDEGSIRLLS